MIKTYRVSNVMRDLPTRFIYQYPWLCRVLPRTATTVSWALYRRVVMYRTTRSGTHTLATCWTHGIPINYLSAVP